MKNKIYLFSAIIALCLFSACSDDDKEKQIIIGNSEELNQRAYADESTGYGFTFRALGSWIATMTETTPGATGNAEDGDASTIPAWLRMSGYNGAAGTHSIDLIFSTNYTGEKRTARIVVNSNGDQITIHVTQEAKTKEGTVPEAGQPVEGISIEQTTLSLNIGDKSVLSAKVLPENATVTTVVWSSSNSNAVSVDSQSGEITALALGTADITATSTADATKKASCAVTVTNAILPNGSGTFTYALTSDPLVVVHGRQSFYTDGESNEVILRFYEEGKEEEALHINFFMKSTSEGLLSGTYYYDPGNEMTNRFNMQASQIEGRNVNCAGGWIAISESEDRIFTIKLNLNTYENDPEDIVTYGLTGTYTGYLKTIHLTE